MRKELKDGKVIETCADCPYALRYRNMHDEYTHYCSKLSSDIFPLRIHEFISKRSMYCLCPLPNASPRKTWEHKGYTISKNKLKKAVKYMASQAETMVGCMSPDEMDEEYEMIKLSKSALLDFIERANIDGL